MVAIGRRRMKERAPAKKEEKRSRGEQNEKKVNSLSVSLFSSKERGKEKKKKLGKRIGQKMAPSSSTSSGGPASNALGTIGGFLLSVCLVPQLYRIYKTRSTTGEMKGLNSPGKLFRPRPRPLSRSTPTSHPSNSIRRHLALLHPDLRRGPRLQFGVPGAGERARWVDIRNGRTRPGSGCHRGKALAGARRSREEGRRGQEKVRGADGEGQEGRRGGGRSSRGGCRGGRGGEDDDDDRRDKSLKKRKDFFFTSTPSSSLALLSLWSPFSCTFIFIQVCAVLLCFLSLHNQMR